MAPRRYSIGHSRSPEVTSGFCTITLDWTKIQAPKKLHCVCLVKTHQGIYHMTFSSEVMTLTWHILKSTFGGHIINHSMRLELVNTVVQLIIMYLCAVKRYVRKNYFLKKKTTRKNFFFAFLASRDLIVDLNSNPLKLVERALKELSGVFFAPFYLF